ncbi:MAG: PAS domain-containing sensor histidine kinase [Nostocaceae cyanobacterium]|nr:PAS domain-containing sensor histidine kinase [Nostocaceae cyanobacterium]
MSRNQPSSWHITRQKHTVSAKPTRLELVPEGTSDIEAYFQESSHGSSQSELPWYQGLYEHLPCVYITVNTRGKILSVNQFGAESLGYTPQDLIHRPIFQLFAPWERQRLSDVLMGLWTASFTETIIQGEYRLHCPGSDIVWVKLIGRILPNKEQEPVILLVCEDITAYKRSEDALRESEQRFHTMADTAPVMLWMSDIEGMHNFFNQPWLDFTGRSMQEELGSGWLECIHPEDQNFCIQTYQSAFENKAKFQIEYRLKRFDSEYRWILDTGVPRFTPSGNFAGYIGSAMDITERKLWEVALQDRQKTAQAQLEEMEFLNRLKDEFLSTVSHELRTPLTNMKMAIQMLGIALNQEQNISTIANSQIPTSKATRYFQILNNECDREINLINNFLDLQRLDAAKPLVLETITVEKWLPQVVDLFKASDDNCYQQNLLLRVADKLPPLMCDPLSLERILIELLTNACKFSPPGEQISVTVQVKSQQMQFQVSNSGVEIPTSELPRIFERFYRIPSNDPWKQGGTGLGLTLVQKLTKYLGGTITTESRSNLTCFTIEIPLKGVQSTGIVTG